MKLCIIEASDDTHEWDSDYVGTGSMALDEAKARVAELETRARTDKPDANECPDGISWRGWHFRLLQEDDDGAYRPL